MSELGNQLARGAGWMILLRFADRGLGIISTILLARLLVPEDFGLVAMATSVSAIIEIMSAFGFETALIQKQNADRVHYDTVWTFNVLFGVGNALLLILLAGPASAFYEESRLQDLLLCVAFGIFVQGFENIGVVAFRKELEFHREFKFLFGKKAIGFVVTIAAAMLLHSYWALVIGIITRQVAGVALSYALHEFRPHFSLVARHEIIHFSKWLLANNMIVFIRARSADFVVGKVSGPHSLGVFNVAMEISSLPTTELSAPVNRAMFPAFAKLSRDTEALRNMYLRVVGLLVLFALPAGAGIAFCGELIVAILFGDKWMEAVPLIKLLAFYGILLVIINNDGVVQLALGKPRINTLVGGLSAAILIPMLVYGIREFGPIGAAWAYVLSAAIGVPISYYLVMKNIDLDVRSLIRVFWRPVIATILMSLALNWFLDYPGILRIVGCDVLRLLASIVFGFVVYSGAVAALWLLSARPDGAELILAREIYRRTSALTAR